MTTVYLVRHAEAEGNVYRRCQGWYNSLITDNGYRQIEALSKRFEGVQVDAVYSSDLFRTMTTAGAVYKPRGLTLRTDPGLREVGVGTWEDHTWGWLRRFDGEKLEQFNVAHPDWSVERSDTFAGLQERVCATILKLAAAHDGQTIALFSHGTAIRTALAKFYGLPLDRITDIAHGDNTCVACLEVENGSVKVLYYNDNSHLGELSTLAKQSWWRDNDRTDYGMVNLWFRPFDPETDGALYRTSREEAWQSVHGTLNGYDGAGFWREAEIKWKENPRNLTVVMQKDTPVGILQLDLKRDAAQGVGHVVFYYLNPATRHHGLGIQLLGQAVSHCRPLGRDKLRLRCAPTNETAQRFYRRYGFRKVGEEPGAYGTLDVLEKYIGYEEQA